MLMPPPDTVQTKATSLVVIFLVFLAGAAVGAVGMRAQMHRNATHLPAWTEGGKPIVMDKWKRELNLSDSQVTAIESTLDDFSRYYDNILAEGRQRVLSVLDPQQRQKFDRMVEQAKH